jgi:YHS domain-containing protein
MKKSYLLMSLLIFGLLLGFTSLNLAADKVVCPVSGKEMQKSEAKDSLTYQGRIYYFCCEGCKEKFLANPEKYISSAEAKDYYICPMHPQVKAEKPGECPECGMKLVCQSQTKASHHMSIKKHPQPCCELKKFLDCKNIEVKFTETETGIIIEIKGKNQAKISEIKKKMAEVQKCLTSSSECQKKEKPTCEKKEKKK